jgi:hypothetical protein
MSGLGWISDNAGTVTVRVPLRVRRHGGRKLMAVSDAPRADERKRLPDNAILKALGRAYRWKRLLETGEFSSISDLAAVEKINHSYIRRILRLTLLSPAMIEMILDDRLPRYVQLEDLLKPFPSEWARQADQSAVNEMYVGQN